MKILLVDPPFFKLMGFRNYGFPMGLALLGAVLETEGHEVRILDADFTGEAPHTNPEFLTSFYPVYLDAIRAAGHPAWKEIEAEVGRFAPDLVGVGIMTPKVASALRVVEAVKRAAPRVPIVAGGPHPTLRAEELLAAAPEIDLVVRGDGFSVLPGLARSFERGEPAPPAGRIVEGDARGIVFDSLPFPARHRLAHRSSYALDELGTLITGMGCPWRCTFCSTHLIWARERHTRSAEKVVAEMRSVHQDHGVRSFSILDDVFTLPRERAIEICGRLAADPRPFTWTCNTHVNLIAAELVRAMRRAGCTKIAVGIESGSERVLKSIRKGVTKEKVREAKRMLDREGMLWTAYFLIGILDETREEMLETIAFMKELDPPFASLGVYENYPGTALFEQGIGAGITRTAMTREELMSLPPNRYYFQGGGRRVAGLGPVEYEETVAFVLRAFHSHNHSWGRLARRAWRKRGDYGKSPGHLLTDLRRLWGKLRIAKERPS